VIEQVVLTLRAGGVDHIVVVTNPQMSALSKLAESAGALVHHLAEPTSDMRASIERGLEFVEPRYQPMPDDAWLLAPADHPAVDVATIRMITETYWTRTTRPIIVPVYAQRRGHPVLIPWRHVEGIKCHPRIEGIDTYLRSYENEILELPVQSRGVI